MRVCAEIITAVVIASLFFSLGHWWAMFKSLIIFGAKRKQIERAGGVWPDDQNMNMQEARENAIGWLLYRLRHPFLAKKL